jgi:hypothetical protein
MVRKFPPAGKEIQAKTIQLRMLYFFSIFMPIRLKIPSTPQYSFCYR